MALMVYPAACWKKTLTYFLTLLNNIELFLQRRQSSAVLEVCRYCSYTKTETCVKQNVNKDLRPIWLTSILSKVAEDFVVECFVKPAVVKMIWKKPVSNDYEMLNKLRLNKYAGHME